MCRGGLRRCAWATLAAPFALATVAGACTPRQPNRALPSSSNATAGNDSAGADGSVAVAALAGSDGASDASTDASVADAAAAYVHYNKVLHVGDSTVGGNGGLAKALKARFEAEGTKYVSDTTVSLAIVTFANSPAFKKLLAKNDPDLVLITLGTNDVFLPSPYNLAGDIKSIAKKSQTGRTRDCIWIGPPTWKPDTGIVETIRENAAPCRFFDSSLMTGVARAGDGIHPTDRGGEAWASLFWTFFRSGAPAEVGAGTFDGGGGSLFDSGVH